MASFQKRNIIYHQSYQRNPLFPKPVKPRNRWRKITIFFSLILLAGLIYLLFFSPYFIIKDIEIKGNKYLNTEELKKIVEADLSSRKYLVLKQNNYFSLLRASFKKTIEAKIQEKIALQNFSLKTKFPSRLIIDLKEKVPNLIYLSGDRYYYLDREGTVTQEIDGTNLNPDFPLVTDENNPEVAIKEKIISDKLAQFIFDLNKSLAEKTTLAIDSFIIPKIECQPEEVIEETDNLNASANLNSSRLNNNANSTANESLPGNTNFQALNKTRTTKECNLRELEEQLTDIQVKVGEDWLIYFESNNDLDQQVNNLLTLTRQLKVTKNLEYIDLRFGTKVYYK